MKKIVLTGGPCGGKTSALEAIKLNFPCQVLVVPEAATILLSGGFPVPGRDLAWSEDWQHDFQASVTVLQTSLEHSYQLMAEQRGATLLVCDRGILDGAAYTPGGAAEFYRRNNINEADAIANYTTVIHLESLAVTAPHLYGRGNNAERFESLVEAQTIEHKIKAAWSVHPQQQVITSISDLNEKIAAVLAIIEQHL